MATLYINPLTPDIHFLILKGEETITRTLMKNLDTASTFPKMLVAIVDEYAITDIWCVTGPGPFTLMRVVTLAINAIAYTRTIRVKSCHFFDLIMNEYTPIIEANPREYLIRRHDEIITITKELIPPGVYGGIFSDIISTEGTKFIQYKEDTIRIMDIFRTRQTENRISPIYFKPPHITGPKTSI